MIDFPNLGFIYVFVFIQIYLYISFQFMCVTKVEPVGCLSFIYIECSYKVVIIL